MDSHKSAGDCGDSIVPGELVISGTLWGDAGDSGEEHRSTGDLGDSHLSPGLLEDCGVHGVSHFSAGLAEDPSTVPGVRDLS